MTVGTDPTACGLVRRDTSRHWEWSQHYWKSHHAQHPHKKSQSYPPRTRPPLLTGHLGEALDIWNKFLDDEEDELRTHLLTMKDIENDYTDSTQKLMGLAPKSKSKAVSTDGKDADTKGKGESELARLQALLERKKFLYEQDALNHGQFLQFTKAEEAAFWAKNLNDAALNAKDKQKVDKLYFEARRAVMLEAEGIDGWDFFITPEAWKEACLGFTARDVARSCADAGVLEPDGRGKFSRSVKIPGHGQPRCYVIRAAALARFQEGEAS